MNNRIYKEIIRAFAYLTEDLKILGIHPYFHFMVNEASIALKLTMTTMNINYKLAPSGKLKAKNADREQYKNSITTL